MYQWSRKHMLQTIQRISDVHHSTDFPLSDGKVVDLTKLNGMRSSDNTYLQTSLKAWIWRIDSSLLEGWWKTVTQPEMFRT